MSEEESSPEKMAASLSLSSVLTESMLEQPKQPTLLSYCLSDLWRFVYMSQVNKNNIQGLEYSSILYGKCELRKQFEPLFNHLYKVHIELA